MYKDKIGGVSSKVKLSQLFTQVIQCPLCGHYHSSLHDRSRTLFAIRRKRKRKGMLLVTCAKCVGKFTAVYNIEDGYICTRIEYQQTTV